MNRVAIYMRVSADDQHTDNQRPECEAIAHRRGEVVKIYEEQASAVKVRPAFNEMLEDGRRGRFDVLVIWAIDRFGRTMAGNISDINTLDRVGVKIVSVKDGWLDTDSPTRSLLIGITSWIAEQERLRIAERTKAGMRRAQRVGTKSGRPIGRAKRRVDVDEARRLMSEGASQRATAKALGLPLGTLQRALARAAA